MKITIDLHLGTFIIQNDAKTFSGKIGNCSYTSIKDIEWLTELEYDVLDASISALSQLGTDISKYQ